MLVEELINSQIPHLRVGSPADLRPTSRPPLFLRFPIRIGQMEGVENYIKSVVNTDRIMRRWHTANKLLTIDVLTQKAGGM